MTTPTRARGGILAVVSALIVSGCSFTPYDLPLPGGADLGDHPYTVKAEFRDAMDLVPQGGVRSSDVTVGRITDVELKGWTALVTMQINGDTRLPDNTMATIRQTSLLGEKFVSLDPPEDEAALGQLSDGDVITLANSGRNPELEEVLSAAALLFNGGGLDQVNVITRELNQLMDGRESDVRDLIQNATTFTQTLDRNKGAILDALEKVDRLAVATNKQEDAIDEALRDIPPALEVVNDQRDDIVQMLEALNNLGDVATGVIKKAKKDTLIDLKLLEPILRELANAGDSLVGSLRSLLTYPFTDEIVKDSVAQAMAPCPEDTVAVAMAGACYGDYWNLDIDLNLNFDQAVLLIEGLLSMSGVLFPGLFPTVAGAAAAGAPEATTASAGAAVPSAAGGSAADAKAAPTSPLAPVTDLLKGATQAPEPAAPQQNGLCALLPLCRTAAASYSSAQQSDLGRILVGPVVAE